MADFIRIRRTSLFLFPLSILNVQPLSFTLNISNVSATLNIRIFGPFLHSVSLPHDWLIWEKNPSSAVSVAHAFLHSGKKKTFGGMILLICFAHEEENILKSRLN